MKTKQEPKKENGKKRNRKKAEDKMKALTLKLLADGLITKEAARRTWQ